MEEIKTKVEGIVVELLGDAAKDMRNVDSLGTDPDFQGRGYGGALVDYITGLADAEGRSTYLLSSKPINTGFYNFHGFVEIGKVFIGEGNPTWKGPPLSVLLVSVFYISSSAYNILTVIRRCCDLLNAGYRYK